MNDAIDATVNGPALWSEILNKIPRSALSFVSFTTPSRLPTPIIAGGAVRDYLWGKEPKDIDVFVNWSQHGLEKAFGQDLYTDDFNPEYVNDPDLGFDELGWIDYVGSVEYKGFNVQFVFVKNPIKHVKTFDLSSSYAIYDGKSIKTFAPFDWTTEHKKLFCVKPGLKTLYRTNRLLEKYPELELV